MNEDGRRRGRVLHVEDNEHWLRAVGTMLCEAGFQCPTAGTGAEAWERLRESFYHVMSQSAKGDVEEEYYIPIPLLRAGRCAMARATHASSAARTPRRKSHRGSTKLVRCEHGQSPYSHN